MSRDEVLEFSRKGYLVSNLSTTKQLQMLAAMVDELRGDQPLGSFEAAPWRQAMAQMINAWAEYQKLCPETERAMERARRLLAEVK